MNDTMHFTGTFAIVHLPSAEECELARQRVRLAALEARLAERERKLGDVRAALAAFTARYREAVGRYIGELADVEAELEDVLARLCPDLADAQARTAERPAPTSALATTSPARERARPWARISDALKRLYHEVARRLHPDLAADERERPLRTRLMAEANRAYAAGDAARLQALLLEWEACPDSVTGSGLEAELARVGRAIAWIEERLRAIVAELRALRRSDLWRFRLRVERAAREGRDLLADLGAEQRAKLAVARRRLAVLARRLEDTSRERPERVLEFPADRSLGTLFVRGRGEGAEDGDWEEFGDARGSLTVPPGVDTRLRVRRKADLRLLGALRADDLQSLDLTTAAVTGGSLVHLCGLTGLQELDLSRNDITDTALRYLAPLVGLRRLDLSHCYVGDDGVATLTDLAGLEQLALAGPYVTDGALPHLDAFPLLRHLDLSHSAVTDAGLARLAALRALRRLSLAGSHVSRAGKAALQRVLPECAIA